MQAAPYRPGFLERWGLGILMRTMRQRQAEPERHRDFQRQTRIVIWSAAGLAFLIGFLITAPLVAYELSFPASPELWSPAFFEKWTAVGLTLALGSILEVYLLYRLGLYAVYRIARLAGVHLEEDHAALVTRLPNMLSRVALEIPDPNLKLLEIDSMRMVNKRTLFVRTMLYRAKIMLSNVVAKIVLRKIFARSALRSYADYIAAPITALWDAAVMLIVLYEVRVRLLSRILAEEIHEQIVTQQDRFRPEFKLVLLQTVGNAIVLAQRFHPTLEYLLVRLHHDFALQRSEALDDWDLYIQRLNALSAPERRVAHELLAVACAFDGHLSGLERRLLSRLPAEFSLSERVDAVTRPIRAGDLEEGRAFCRLSLAAIV